MQAQVRSALSYLLNRPDVDPKRIALIGDALTGTIAADLNPEFNALVLTHAAPDITETDACFTVPGLLQYADTPMLLASVAPRPLLLFESRSPVIESVRNSYSQRGAGSQLRVRDETDESQTRMEIYRWLRSQLMKDATSEITETTDPANVTRGLIPPPPAQPSKPVTPSLTDLLGTPLPATNNNFTIPRCAPSQRVTTTTQPGFDIPVTVLRPGPLGCDHQDGILVAFADEGRASLENDPFLLEAVRHNWMVWIVDPRGIGELKSSADAYIFTTSVLLGENFAWRQAADIARLTENASALSPIKPASMPKANSRASSQATRSTSPVMSASPG